MAVYQNVFLTCGNFLNKINNIFQIILITNGSSLF